MLTIHDSWLHETNLSEAELRLELALSLLERGRISFEQAQKLAQLEVLEFLQHVQKRGISLEYGTEDLMQDVHTLQQLGQL